MNSLSSQQLIAVETTAKREPLTARLSLHFRPLERCHLAFLGMLFLLGVGLAVTGRLDIWPWLLSDLIGLIGIVCFVAWLSRFQDRYLGVQLAMELYSLPLVLMVFNSLQPLITGLGFPNQDAALIAADRLLLGGHDATRVLFEFSTPWLNDLMYLGYLSYFLFPITVALTMFRRSPALARQFIFTALVGFYASYAGYLFVPARGPRLVQWPAGDVTLKTGWISRTIADSLNGAEYTKDDVFPSGHVTIAVLCLICAWKFDRRLFGGLLPVALLLCVSTVYCRYHYVVDAVAGLALACLVQPVGYRVYRAFRI